MNQTPAIPAAAPRLTTARSVLIVILFAAALRWWCFASIPMVITNDGTGYLRWSVQFHSGHMADIPRLRTPGYPLFLAGAFQLFGVGPLAVLAAQHMLGVLWCALIALLAARMASPVLGILLGLLAAVDPWALTYECYALTETLTLTLSTLAVAIVLLAPPGRTWPAILLGLVLAAGCLVRPAAQMLVPFLVFAWALTRGRTWASATSGVILTLIFFAGGVAPWLKFNADRGLYGFADGGGSFFWMGAARGGLLNLDYPVDPELRDAYKALGHKSSNYDELSAFSRNLGALDYRSSQFSRWARDAITSHPLQYAALLPHALGWQLNRHPPSERDYAESDWFVGRLGRAGDDGDNRQFDDGTFASLDLEQFRMVAAGGSPLSRAFRWYGRNIPKFGGIPQIPLFACAVLATLIAAFRRRWTLTLALAGTLALSLIHVAMLVPWARYSFPMWGIWYAAPALLVAALRRERRLPSSWSAK